MLAQVDKSNEDVTMGQQLAGPLLQLQNTAREIAQVRVLQPAATAACYSQLQC